MKDVTIDTDVILDFLFDRVPFSQKASEILSKCEDGEIKGFVTSVTLSNIYYLLRKTATHSKVIESLRLLMSFLHVATTDKTAVINALILILKILNMPCRIFLRRMTIRLK